MTLFIADYKMIGSVSRVSELDGFCPFFFLPFELQIHAIPLVHCEETQIHVIIYSYLNICIRKKERKKDDFNVATGMDYDVDSFSSW